MRYPEFLKDNQRIGFIAPSFGAVMEPYHTRFESAKAKFEAMGYTVVLGPNVYADRGVGKSNTAQACGAEVNDFFLNDRSDVIISCGGGETMCEDLEYIDFKAIADAKPIWYMGYSDNTNLTLTLPTLCDTAAIYGPCAGTFGMRHWHEAVDDAYRLIRGEKLSMTNYDGWELEEKEDQGPLDTYNATQAFCMSMLNGDEASFSGRLLGGCLDVMTVLCGTPYDKVKEFTSRYEKDGVIWFIEACELDPMGVRRALWQLDSAGWFRNAKGFIFGRPMHFDLEFMGLNRFNGGKSILGKYNVPIIFDVDLGHLPPMMPLISGAMADVTAANGKFRIDMRLE